MKSILNEVRSLAMRIKAAQNPNELLDNLLNDKSYHKIREL